MDVNIIILYMNMNNGIIYIIICLFILGSIKILWLCSKTFDEQEASNVNKIKFSKWKAVYFTLIKIAVHHVLMFSLEYR